MVCTYSPETFPKHTKTHCRLDSFHASLYNTSHDKSIILLECACAIPKTISLSSFFSHFQFVFGLFRLNFVACLVSFGIVF